MGCNWNNILYRRLPGVLLIFVAISCSPDHEAYQSGAMQKHFEAQVSARLNEFGKLDAKFEPLKNHVHAVHGKINELVLLSKDIENPGASVNLSNAYFRNLAAAGNLQVDDFEMLNTGMDADEAGMLLRRNELNYFNQLLLKQGGVNRMFTAQ